MHCPLTHRTDVIGFNEIFTQLSMLQLAVYAPLSYILPSRVAKYQEMYDTEVRGGGGNRRCPSSRSRPRHEKRGTSKEATAEQAEATGRHKADAR